MLGVAQDAPPHTTEPGDDTDVYVVPAGYYFVMGDNRDNSLDSRFSPSMGGVGLLPAENLVGTAVPGGKSSRN